MASGKKGGTKARPARKSAPSKTVGRLDAVPESDSVGTSGTSTATSNRVRTPARTRPPRPRASRAKTASKPQGATAEQGVESKKKGPQTLAEKWAAVQKKIDELNAAADPRTGRDHSKDPAPVELVPQGVIDQTTGVFYQPITIPGMPDKPLLSVEMGSANPGEHPPTIEQTAFPAPLLKAVDEGGIKRVPKDAVTPRDGSTHFELHTAPTVKADTMGPARVGQAGDGSARKAAVAGAQPGSKENESNESK